jgi:hypothetical protein
VIVLHVWMSFVRVSNPAGVIIVEEAPGELSTVLWCVRM